MTEIHVRDHDIEAPYAHSTGPNLSRFFTALRDDDVFLGARCDACDRVVVPPTDHCDRCAAPLLDLHPIGPEGTVTGLTVVHVPTPLVDLEPPFAVVRLRPAGADTDLLFPTSEIPEIGDTLPLPKSPQPKVKYPVPPGDSITSVRTHLRLPFRHAAGAVESRFGDALRDGELCGNRCPGCDAVYVPPRPFCARCSVSCEGWERVADVGTVTTFVVVNVPFYGQEIEIPYVLAQIRVDGADTTFLHLVGVTSDEGKLVSPPGGTRIGMRVRAIWRDPSERRGLLNDDIDRFEPVEGDQE